MGKIEIFLLKFVESDFNIQFLEILALESVKLYYLIYYDMLSLFLVDIN